MTRKPISSQDVYVGFLRRWVVLFGNFAAGLVFVLYLLQFFAWLYHGSVLDGLQLPDWVRVGQPVIALFVALLVALIIVALCVRIWANAGFRNRVREYITREEPDYWIMRRAALSWLLSSTLKSWAKSDHSEDPYLVCRNACHSAHLYGVASKFVPWPMAVADPFDPKPRKVGVGTASNDPGGKDKQKAKAKEKVSRTTSAGVVAGSASVGSKWKHDHLLSVFNDIIAEKIAKALNVKLVHSHASHIEFKRSYRTDSRSQKSYLYDGGDLPLRFSQHFPGGRFDSERAEGDGAPGLKPRYLIVFCLANPIEDPVYVLPLASVLRRLQEKYSGEPKDSGPKDSGPKDGKVAAPSPSVIEVLTTQTVPLFTDGIPVGPLQENVFKIESRNRHVLKAVDKQMFSGFDIHHVDFQKTLQWDRSALAKFNESIDRCIDATRTDASGREIDDGEFEICLNAGDILIIDNYAAFHRRREMPVSAWPMVTRLPKRRCLQIYCGYPHESGHGEAHASGDGPKKSPSPPRFLRNGVVDDIYAPDDTAA